LEGRFQERGAVFCSSLRRSIEALVFRKKDAGTACCWKRGREGFLWGQFVTRDGLQFQLKLRGLRTPVFMDQYLRQNWGARDEELNFRFFLAVDAEAAGGGEKPD